MQLQYGSIDFLPPPWFALARPLPTAECHAYAVPPNATLEEWAQHSPDNWVTRELVGRSALYDWRRRPLTPADLDTAKRRLHAFAAVLLLERPASSMALLRARFGWTQLGWDEHRAGSRAESNAAAELAPAAMARLRARHEWDLQLHAYAQALHEAQVQLYTT